MPMPDNRSKYTKYKRTNLFLLRVWCDDLDPEENKNEDMDAESGRKWHGRVQGSHCRRVALYLTPSNFVSV